VRRAGALILGSSGLRYLTLVTTIAYAAAFALLAHISPFLADAGVAASTIGNLVGSIAFAAMVGVILSGAATQRWSTRALGVVSLLGFTAAAVVLGAIALGAAAPALPTVFGTVLLFGLMLGGADAVWIEHVRRLSPPQDFPAIYGWWYLTVLVSLTVAPIVVGAIYDAVGSYWSVFFGLAAALVAGIVVLRVAVPQGSRV
jgi:predicted MFS family arabinose efflux permease